MFSRSGVKWDNIVGKWVNGVKVISISNRLEFRNELG